ncbi:hypothetical protein [Nocardia sp. IFM 10818]
MPDTSRPHPGSGRSGPATTMSDDDLFLLVIGAALAVPGILLTIPAWRDIAVAWLADHHVLVAAGAHPVWTLPGDVAGFDTRRLILLGLALAAALAGLTSLAWHRYQRWLQRRLTTGDQS